MISSPGNDSGFVLLDAILLLGVLTILLLPISRAAFAASAAEETVTAAAVERFAFDQPENSLLHE